jgi:hypothetical protein
MYLGQGNDVVRHLSGCPVGYPDVRERGGVGAAQVDVVDHGPGRIADAERLVTPAVVALRVGDEVHSDLGPYHPAAPNALISEDGVEIDVTLAGDALKQVHRRGPDSRRQIPARADGADLVEEAPDLERVSRSDLSVARGVTIEQLGVFLPERPHPLNRPGRQLELRHAQHCAQGFERLLARWCQEHGVHEGHGHPPRAAGQRQRHDGRLGRGRVGLPGAVEAELEPGEVAERRQVSPGQVGREHDSVRGAADDPSLQGS